MVSLTYIEYSPPQLFACPQYRMGVERDCKHTHKYTYLEKIDKMQHEYHVTQLKYCTGTVLLYLPESPEVLATIY